MVRQRKSEQCFSKRCNYCGHGGGAKTTRGTSVGSRNDLEQNLPYFSHNCKYGAVNSQETFHRLSAGNRLNRRREKAKIAPDTGADVYDATDIKIAFSGSPHFV